MLIDARNNKGMKNIMSVSNHKKIKRKEISQMKIKKKIRMKIEIKKNKSKNSDNIKDFVNNELIEPVILYGMNKKGSESLIKISENNNEIKVCEIGRGQNNNNMTDNMETRIKTQSKKEDTGNLVNPFAF